MNHLRVGYASLLPFSFFIFVSVGLAGSYLVKGLSQRFCVSSVGSHLLYQPPDDYAKKIKESKVGAKLKEPTLSSAQTGYQPRQAKSAEAVSAFETELRKKWRRERDSNSRTRVKPSQFLSRKSLSATQPSLHLPIQLYFPSQNPFKAKMITEN